MYRPEPRKAALQELNRSPQSGTGLIVLVPSRDGTITVETAVALNGNLDGLPRCLMTVSRRPVVQARNDLWRMATEAVPQLPWSETYCLWLDSDAYFLAGTVSKMIDALRAHPQIDVLSGAYCTRVPYARIIGNRIAGKSSPPTPGSNCTLGDLVEVKEIGFHFVLHRTELRPSFSPTPSNDSVKWARIFPGRDESAKPVGDSLSPRRPWRPMWIQGMDQHMFLGTT